MTASRSTSWRLDEADRRISTAVLAGHLTEAQGQSQQRRDHAAAQPAHLGLARAAHRLEAPGEARRRGGRQRGARRDRRPADQGGDDPRGTPRLAASRSSPSSTSAASPRRATQKADAKAKADAALKDLQGGKAWDDVAKTVSTDASTAPQAGDLGWIEGTGDSADPDFLKALFAADVNVPTAVVEGADGTYRIGRVTEIAPEAVDTAYQAKIVNDGVPLDHYRAVLAADVLHDKLQTKIVGDITGPSAAAPTCRRSTSARRPRTWAPTRSRSATSSIRRRTIRRARQRSRRTTPPGRRPTARPSRPGPGSRTTRTCSTPSPATESDEGQAQGPTGSGGKLPFFDSQSQVDDAFKAAILAPGLKDGQILDPVKSAFGWHIIQVMYHPTEADHFKTLKSEADNGTDFGILARDTSVAPTAGSRRRHGLDRQGPARRQADRRHLRDADRQDLRGRCQSPSDGTYLFKVLAEENRTPEGKQLDELTSTAFSKWYDAKKSAALITRDAAITGGNDQLAGGPGCSTHSSPRRDSAGGSIPRTASRSSRASRWSPSRSSRRGRS